MYAPFFGLKREAFSIAPDPRFLHLSAMHREALAHLLYGLQGGGGFVLLTGEVGTGKTTVCRTFLEQIPPGHRAAYVYNPKLSPVELMQTVCQEFRIPVQGATADTIKPYVDALNRFLLEAHARGEQCLLVVDEAQALSGRLLELLRLLTNLETRDRKLLQIVLIGQPELRTRLAQPDLEQLSQRVIARVHLGPLSAAETVAYVGHRLSVAGLDGPVPFGRRALALVHRLSGGIPRRINLLCERALLGAYAMGQHQIGAGVVRKAAGEVFGTPGMRVALGTAAAASAAMVLLAAAVAAWWWWARQPRPAAAPSLAVAQAAASAVVPASSPPPAKSADSAPPVAYADDASAGAALAAAWSLQVVDGDALCKQARRNALACHEGTADLALLRKLQRPALLRLHSGGQVLLAALTGEVAVLGTAAGERRHTLESLQAAWTGTYTTLWRPPPGWFAAGERANSESASWVLERLTALQGESHPGGGRIGREDALRQRVFAFQVAQGLTLDGLAGPITLMQLNRATGIDEPSLRPEP